ncbi:MAG TPA: hypothetical protein VMG13_13960 [Trebonia sp.]|nr:hypothetical protein [Trebonia sp.]
MSDFESRMRQLIDPFKAKLTSWWSAFMSRTGNSAEMRREATARAHRAASDLRDSDTAKRAASALKDLRDSDTAKRAASALNDLRDSDTAKRAASALSDLRQRDSVRKAEESAKRALHDLRSGHGDGSSES